MKCKLSRKLSLLSNRIATDGNEFNRKPYNINKYLFIQSFDIVPCIRLGLLCFRLICNYLTIAVIIDSNGSFQRKAASLCKWTSDIFYKRSENCCRVYWNSGRQKNNIKGGERYHESTIFVFCKISNKSKYNRALNIEISIF